MTEDEIRDIVIDQVKELPEEILVQLMQALGSNQVVISKAEYDGLVEEYVKLCLLEAGGVEDWEGFADAVEPLEEHNRTMEVILKSKLDFLRRREAILSHLESLGVDNWGGYQIPEDLLS